jgi:hypothetical protein
MKTKQSEIVDAVEMKRRIQEQIYNETNHMTPDELLAYFRTRIANSRFAQFLASEEESQQVDIGKVSHGI